MSQHDLQFLNPVHEPGENVTVRLGHKWKNRVEVGDIVKIVKTGEEDKPLGFGIITGVLVCPFGSIPQNLLVKEHDISCREMLGLEQAMERANRSTFDNTRDVTVLSYRFQPIIPQFLTRVFTDILAERGYEETQWSQAFDDKNTVNDWAGYVNIYMARAAAYGNRSNTYAQRSGFLKACCLLVSAIFTCDLNAGFAPRHYEEVDKETERPH